MIKLDQLGAATLDKSTGDITFERIAVPGATAARWIDALQQLTEPTQDPFCYVERDYRALLQSRELRLGDVPLLDAIVEIAGSIADWLGTTRTYSDHTRRRLKEEDLAQCMEFESAERHEYDTHLGYRFCARLRNYSQHFKLPVHQIRLTASEASVLVNRDTLLEKYNCWSTVRADIAVMEQALPIYPLIDEAMASLRNINSVIALPPPSSWLSVISSYHELHDYFMNHHPAHIPFLFSFAGASLDVGSNLRFDTLYEWPFLDQLASDIEARLERASADGTAQLD